MRASVNVNIDKQIACSSATRPVGQRRPRHLPGHSAAWLLAVLSGVGVIGCSPANEEEKVTTKVASDGTLAATPVIRDATVSVPRNAGPAARCVASFFQDWKAKHYEAMHGRLVSARPLDAFRNALTRTPVRWRSVEILQETGEEGDRSVSFSMELTDLLSVMSAYACNYAPTSPICGKASEANLFPETPNSLGIETFCGIKQTWRVVGRGDDLRIRVGESPNENILRYFTDAAERTYDSSASSAPMFDLNMARVLVELSKYVGVDHAEKKRIMGEIKPRAQLGLEHYQKSDRR